jgi:hypothetical protein
VGQIEPSIDKPTETDMNKPTPKNSINKKPENQEANKGQPSKLSDSDLDKVAGGIGGLGAPIPVKR